MPIDTTALWYTYMTQGSQFTTPSSKATQDVLYTFFNNVTDPTHTNPLHGYGADTFNQILITLPDDSAIASLDVDIFELNPKLSGAKYVHARGDAYKNIWIDFYDENHNYMNDLPHIGTSVNMTTYEEYCCIAGSPPTRGPLILSLTGYYDEVNQQDRVAFNWFSPYIRGDVYSFPGVYVEVSHYSGVNDTFFDFLCDGRYADTGQIAPTGGEEGGGGLYDRPDEEIPIPSLPSISVCDTGFISLYVMTTAEMQALGNFLWSNSFTDNILKNFMSPFDNIVSLQMIPFTPLGNTQNVKIGNIDTGVQGDKLSTSYFEVDCGIKYCSEYYKTFADYAPYTKLHIFLPYCGIFEINPDDVFNPNDDIGGGIKVIYHIDIFSGSCVAFVQCNSGGKWHVLQQHAGNISAQFPITGANFASVYIGAINAIGSVIGGAAGGAMGVLGGGISGMNSIMNAKPEFQRSGGVTSVSGIMGIQYPYLIYSTPQYIVAENFRDVKGHVSNLKCTVSSCSGFLQATADNSELSGIGCTAYELDLIRNLLAEGIYV